MSYGIWCHIEQDTHTMVSERVAIFVFNANQWEKLCVSSHHKLFYEFVILRHTHFNSCTSRSFSAQHEPNDLGQHLLFFRAHINLINCSHRARLILNHMFKWQYLNLHTQVSYSSESLLKIYATEAIHCRLHTPC